MKKSKRRNPQIGGDALANVRRRVAGNPRLRTRIDASVVRATIAVMVKRARTQAGLTQAQLATRAKTTQAVVARIEGGSVFTPSLDLLDRIARALGGRLSGVRGDRHAGSLARTVANILQINAAALGVTRRHAGAHCRGIGLRCPNTEG